LWSGDHELGAGLGGAGAEVVVALEDELEVAGAGEREVLLPEQDAIEAPRALDEPVPLALPASEILSISARFVDGEGRRLQVWSSP
jgi:hypothetical protein